MPLIATRGAASAQGFGEFAQATAVNYIEDMFSTYLYTGNGSTQTITNGIDLAGDGGLTWIKYRDGAFGNGHYLYDTVRGAGKALQSNLTDAETATDSRLTSFNSDGFSLSTAGGSGINASTYPYVSWTFREQPKFFDIVTYTGDGVAGRTVAHNLGSVPGCIMVKNISRATDWIVYHRSIGATGALYLNTTTATVTATSFWNNTSPTSTQFTTGTWTGTNYSGDTFVAYLFAHDAGGFGLTGTDNVISCGTFTTDGGANADVTLGYEPQFVITKSTSVVDWYVSDIMRDMSVTNSRYLIPNTSGAEVSNGSGVWIPTATGLQIRGLGSGGQTHIYIAIRRGPMKVPTLGTTVFAPIARTGTGSAVTVSTSLISTDAVLTLNRGGGTYTPFVNRLVGTGRYLTPVDTVAEITQTETVQFDANDAVKWPASTAFGGSGNLSGNSYVNYLFRRAPGFFDVVCYTGLDTNQTVNHNLGVAPELIIVKRRNGTAYWPVYSQNIIGTNIGGAGRSTPYINVDFAAGGLDADFWTATVPTTTTFTLAGGGLWTNSSGNTYVAYLFATCAGVSKVGSYTGTGALQTVACGFTSGARFVLIKRADSTGDWYVWDSARGITSGNDPYLLLNSTAAEVTSTNYVDTDTTGFKVTAAAPAALNASGGTYIFLAVA